MPWDAQAPLWGQQHSEPVFAFSDSEEEGVHHGTQSWCEPQQWRHLSSGSGKGRVRSAVVRGVSAARNADPRRPMERSEGAQCDGTFGEEYYDSGVWGTDVLAMDERTFPVTPSASSFRGTSGRLGVMPPPPPPPPPPVYPPRDQDWQDHINDSHRNVNVGQHGNRGPEQHHGRREQVRAPPNRDGRCNQWASNKDRGRRDHALPSHEPCRVEFEVLNNEVPHQASNFARADDGACEQQSGSEEMDAACSKKTSRLHRLRKRSHKHKLTTKLASLSNNGAWEPNQHQVLEAVGSLYVDQLRPYSCTLLKRVRELLGEKLGSSREDLNNVPGVDPEVLYKVACSCPSLEVHKAGRRGFVVYVKGVPEIFVDLESAQDSYSDTLWPELQAAFLAYHADGGTDYPKGNYLCARRFIAMELSCLTDCTLGEVCHIVHLSTSKKHVLGYQGGYVVPWEESDAFKKQSCARNCTPVERPAAKHWPCMSWADMQRCMCEILETLGWITMSNMKRVFRARCDMELSETALGYTHLVDLLRDPRLSHICAVRALGNGQYRVYDARRCTEWDEGGVVDARGILVDAPTGVSAMR